MAWYLLPLLFVSVSCGTLQKWALRSSTPVLEKSSEGLMHEGNWEFFRASAPANIKFLELIWLQDQDNFKLLSVLIKSYAGYALGVHESIALEDELSGAEDSQAKKDAIIFYTRALDYGLTYLKHKGIERSDLLSNDFDKLKNKLKEFDEDDATALLYTGMAWGGLINLQKDNVSLVSQIPNVKLLFDRACWIKHNIDHNVCDIFLLNMNLPVRKCWVAIRKKARSFSLRLSTSIPVILLIRMNYIQFSILPMMDAEKYEKQSLVMKEEIAKWEDLNRDGLESVSTYKNSAELNLYNAIAKKRFLAVEKYKSKIFE
jgi:hypothetical protein